MVLISLDASHRELDLGALERLSVGARSLARAALAGPSAAAGAVVLATCNRLEVYLDVAQPAEADAAGPPGGSRGSDGSAVGAAIGVTTAAVAAISGVAVDEVGAAMRIRTGAAVSAHLFAVAAGLESMVVGEREIGGQVRRALSAARTEQTTTPHLDRLFQSASRVARVAHAGTGLGGDGRSVVAVALDLVAVDDRPWEEVRAVLVGTGSYAGASLAALRARGCTDVRVFSPSGRADGFAAAHAIPVVSGPDLAAAVAEADLVLACSGSGGVGLAVGEPHRRRDRPLVVVDLALRGDVDRRITTDPAVRLIDLQDIRAAAPPQQRESVAAARAVVRAAVTEFEGAARTRSADQAVVALRRHVQELVETEVERVRGRGPAATAEVEQALHRFSRALLHAPTVRARDLAARGEQGEYVDALRTLFGIEAGSEPAGPEPADQPALVHGRDSAPRVPPVHTGPMGSVVVGCAAPAGGHDREPARSAK